MWSGEFVSTWTGSPKKFTSANPPVHDLSLLVFSFYMHIA